MGAARVTGVDVDAAALVVARRNAARFGGASGGGSEGGSEGGGEGEGEGGGDPHAPHPHRRRKRRVNPEAGQRFDPSRVLLDPYAVGVVSARRRYGELGPDLPAPAPGAAPSSRTWPLAAGTLPSPPPNSVSAPAPPLCPLARLCPRFPHPLLTSAERASAGLVSRVPFFQYAFFPM